jgi:hypothetical protein
VSRLFCTPLPALRPTTLVLGSLLAFTVPDPTQADEIVSANGDRLTGRILAIGCDGLDFAYVNNQRLRIPLAALTKAETADNVTLPMRGADHITGVLAIEGGMVRIRSTAFGSVLLRPADLPPLPLSPSPGKSQEPGQPRSQGAPCPGSDTALGRGPVQGLGNRAVEGAKLTAISGTGAQGSTTDQPAQQAAAAPNGVPSPMQAAAPAASADAASPSDPSASAEPAPEEEPLQFLRTEAVLLQPYKLEGDLLVSYLRNNQTVQNDKVASVTAAVRFGLIKNMEGFVQLPYSWGQREINTFNGVERNNVNGIGDVRFGLKYSLIPQSATLPNIIANLSASAPTGQEPYLKPPPDAPATLLSRDIRDPLSVQLGTGHWSMTGGLTAIKSFDPLILFGSVSYTHYFPEEYFGVNIEPGDLYDVNAGLGFAVNDSGTISGQVFAGYQEEWTFNGTHVAETRTSPISLRLAYTHILSPRDLIEPSVLFGLTGDANDALLGLSYSHNF